MIEQPVGHKSISVLGKIIAAHATFVRPANTTGYTAGDAVNHSASAPVLFVVQLGRFTGATGYIVGAKIVTNKKSLTPKFRVHLFNEIPSLVVADNSPWTELYADRATRIGRFDMSAMTTAANVAGSDMSRAEEVELRVPIITGVNGAVYVGLETLDAFTPDSDQSFSLTILADQN